MSDINQLAADSSLSLGDQLAIFSTNNGDTRRMSLSTLLAFLQSNLLIPGGILSAASLYNMRAPVAGLPVVNVTTVAAPIANQDPTLNIALPATNTAFFINAPTGQFIAQRNVRVALMNFNIAMTYAAARLLKLQIATGPVSNPLQYLTPIAWQALGQTATQMYANAAGVVYNPNNINGQINTGDIVQLVASIDVNAAIAIQALSTQIQPLDGI